jgi:hypothetical protein
VVPNVGVVAPGVLKCVGKDGEAVECAIGVDTFGEGCDRRCEPSGIGGHREEGVAEEFTDQVTV